MDHLLPRSIVITLTLLIFGSAWALRREHASWRIIHGEPISITKVPYQVSIEVDYQHSCGGALAHARVIITAAHCLMHIKKKYNVPSKELTVRVGTSMAGRGGAVYEVKAIEMYPNYTMNPDYGDLGIVLLHKPVKLDKRARTIGISTRTPKVGQMGLVTGYGSQEINTGKHQRQAVPGLLMMIEIPIFPKRECYQKIKEVSGEIVEEDMICAGYQHDHRDACQGDSGGPMVIDGQLVALTAWGLGCGQKHLPGIYLDLSFHIDWIQKCSDLLLLGKTCSRLAVSHPKV